MFQRFTDRLRSAKKGTAAVHSVPDTKKPMLRKSICTGETTAGFRDLATGKYTEVMLIRDEKDLQQFMKEYGLTERPETEY